MASSFTLSGDWLISMGNRMMTRGTGNLGSLYATDGIAVTPQQVGLGQIQEMQIAPTAGYVFEYIPSTGKIKAYQSDDAVDPLDEVGAVDISTAIFRFTAIGYC